MGTDEVKNPVQIEFADLMEEMRKRGFRPIQIAEMLGLSRASVSQYLAGNSTPKGNTMELFRRIVGEQSDANSLMLRESSPESELEIWKRRAKIAERDLHTLRHALQQLAGGDLDAASSGPLSDAAQLLKRADASAKTDPKE